MFRMVDSSLTENERFVEVDFYDTDLDGRRFISCRFNGRAKLDGLDLSDVRLAEADLSESSLKRVVFDDADLTGATLRGCNLREADLRGARVDSVNLAGARFASTRMDVDGALAVAVAQGIVIG